jgi:hypothetical protein
VSEARESAWFGERYVVEFDDPAGKVRLRFPVKVEAALHAARRHALPAA